jgi:hypothetical protein
MVQGENRDITEKKNRRNFDSRCSINNPIERKEQKKKKKAVTPVNAVC